MVALLRLPQVLARKGNSKSTLYQEIADGVFTPAIKVGRRASLWPDYEVEAINRARIAGRTEEEVKELVARLVKERANSDAPR